MSIHSHVSRFIPVCLAFGLAVSARAEVLAWWDFNSRPPDADFNTGTLLPAWGAGTAALVGGVSASFTASNGSSDSAADNSNWRITTWPAQGTGNKTHGVRLAASTAGRRRIRVEFDLRASNTASKYVRLQYTTNGTAFLDHAVITLPAETWLTGQTISLEGLPGVDNNPQFALRFVTEFERTAIGTGSSNYAPASASSTYGANGTLRFDMIIVSGDPLSPDPARTVKVVQYNVWGGDATNWTTATPQVQAIGRQLAHLAPDVVTLQEIPDLGLAGMPGIVAAYLPGFFLATNRVGDGTKGNFILSRWPILRSTSHLGRTNLLAWGFDGAFTRDLFEAEIAVPGWNEPLHAFTVHLKAFNDAESGPRRAAEASAVSNHFVNAFLPVKGQRPHFLAGDFNEDIDRPRSYEQGAMARVINAQTGLRLTTPRDPFTADERTWSSRNPSPTIRFDYLLPGGLLATNLGTNWVFRTDRLQPTPPALLAGDSQTASDHLPLVTLFGNPYRLPSSFPVRVRLDAQNVTITWNSAVGGRYTVLASTNLTAWTAASPVFTAAGTNLTWTTARGVPRSYFRVREER